MKEGKEWYIVKGLAWDEIYKINGDLLK